MLIMFLLYGTLLLSLLSLLLLLLRECWATWQMIYFVFYVCFLVDLLQYMNMSWAADSALQHTAPLPLYLWFLPKQPQFVLGSAHGVFWISPAPEGSISLLVSFRCVAYGPIWTRSAQILTEVLKGEVAWRLKARLKGLHDNCWILGRTNRQTDEMLGDKTRELIAIVTFLLFPQRVNPSSILLHTLCSSTALAAETIPSKHLDTMGMTFRSASAKLWYVSPSFTVRRSSMACRFWHTEQRTPGACHRG